MKNRRAVGLLNLMRDKKNEGKNRGGEGVGLLNPMRDKKIEGKNREEEGTTPVTTACPEAGK